MLLVLPLVSSITEGLVLQEMRGGGGNSGKDWK
jgi:hypothetical protein